MNKMIKLKNLNETYKMSKQRLAGMQVLKSVYQLACLTVDTVGVGLSVKGWALQPACFAPQASQVLH